MQLNEDFPTNQPTHRPLVNMSTPTPTGNVALPINTDPPSTNTVIARPTKLVRLKLSKARCATVNQILLLPPKRALSPPPYHPHRQMLKRPLLEDGEEGSSSAKKSRPDPIYDFSRYSYVSIRTLHPDEFEAKRKMRKVEDDEARERRETVTQSRVGEMLHSKIKDLEAVLRLEREENVERVKGMEKLRCRVRDLGCELKKEREKSVERAKVVTEQVREIGELRSMVKDLDCELQKERELKRIAVKELLGCRTAKEKLEKLKHAMAAVME